MAEVIIPSPSVFLRASPGLPSPPVESVPSKNGRSRPPRPKKETTKIAASVKKSKEAVSGTTTSPKPKQTKSRNGCATCKIKRLKCDEAKPECEQCKRRSLPCGGYKKSFKWRPFGEVTAKIGVYGSGNARPSTKDDLKTQALESVVECQPYPIDGQAQYDSLDASSVESETKTSLDYEPTTSIEHLEAYLAPECPQTPSYPTGNLHAIEMAASTDQDSDMLINPSPDIFFGAGQISPGFGKRFVFSESMSLDDEMRPVDGDGLDMLRDATRWLDEDLTRASNGFEIPDVRRQSSLRPLAMSPVVTLPTPPVSMPASNSPVASGLPMPSSLPMLPPSPPFAVDSTEMVALRFDRITCGILSIKNGENENPWRTIVWPMAQTSAALHHAILAMSAFHSARDVPQLRLTGQEHNQLSVKNLIHGIQEGSMTLENAIATTLALAFADSWDHHTTSGNNHIQGARTMINMALSEHRRNPLSGIHLARLKFLCNVWVYMDVIARTTSVDEDESDDYDKIYTLYSNPHARHSGFGIDFGMPIDAALDPLMGCASTLFPLIGRVANLVRRVRRSPTNSPPIISQAMELKQLIETWEPPSMIEAPRDPTCSIPHSVQTAEGYRWATLLYLHQAVPEIPNPYCAADMAEKVLVFLATVPLTSRLVISHIFPMMAAGAEATKEEDRHWVRGRWEAMGLRLRIGSIDKCMDVTEEVWRRRDDYEMELRVAGLRGKRLAPRGDEQRTSGLDTAFTVRGALHWLGVMRDWNWEILLG